MLRSAVPYLGTSYINVRITSKPVLSKADNPGDLFSDLVKPPVNKNFHPSRTNNDIYMELNNCSKV